MIGGHLVIRIFYQMIIRNIQIRSIISTVHRAKKWRKRVLMNFSEVEGSISTMHQMLLCTNILAASIRTSKLELLIAQPQHFQSSTVYLSPFVMAF